MTDHPENTNTEQAARSLAYRAGMGGHHPSDLTDSRDPLVGREPEIEAISEAIEQVQEGSGQAMVVTGPLGIGKSQLMDEAANLSSRRSFGILRGAGSLIGTSLAFAPIVHGVGRALHEMEPPKRAKLVRGLDSLGVLLEGLDLPAPTPLGDPSLERTRLFESTVRLIDRLAADQPLLISFDDIQWIDGASLDLLTYLAMDLSSMDILLLVSIDPHEPSPRAERFVNQLRRTTTCIELSLNPLEAAQVGRLAEQVLNGPVRPRDAEALAEMAGGNPWLTLEYIDELVRRGDLRLVEGRWAITVGPEDRVPAVAREAYASRISRLDDGARAILEIIAIGGGEVSHQHSERCQNSKMRS